MYKVFSLIGVFLAVLMVYVAVETALESAMRRRTTSPNHDGPSEPAKLTPTHKRLLFAGLIGVAVVFVIVFWSKL